MDDILEIYLLQEDNYVQSSDLHLQYLKKDSNEEWTNKEAHIESETMLVDIFPKCINELDIKMAEEEIIKMKTYDILMTQIYKDKLIIVIYHIMIFLFG